LADGGNHQGVAARALPFKYLTLTGLLDRVKILTADPFLLVTEVPYFMSAKNRG